MSMRVSTFPSRSSFPTTPEVAHNLARDLQHDRWRSKRRNAHPCRLPTPTVT